jgi:hypothetical protein
MIKNNMWSLIEHEHGPFALIMNLFESSRKFGQVEKELRMVATKVLGNLKRVDESGLASDYSIIKPLMKCLYYSNYHKTQVYFKNHLL